MQVLQVIFSVSGMLPAQFCTSYDGLLIRILYFYRLPFVSEALHYRLVDAFTTFHRRLASYDGTERRSARNRRCGFTIRWAGSGRFRAAVPHVVQFCYAKSLSEAPSDALVRRVISTRGEG